MQTAWYVSMVPNLAVSRFDQPSRPSLVKLNLDHPFVGLYSKPAASTTGEIASFSNPEIWGSKSHGFQGGFSLRPMLCRLPRWRGNSAVGGRRKATRICKNGGGEIFTHKFDC